MLRNAVVYVKFCKKEPAFGRVVTSLTRWVTRCLELHPIATALESCSRMLPGHLGAFPKLAGGLLRDAVGALGERG